MTAEHSNGRGKIAVDRLEAMRAAAKGATADTPRPIAPPKPKQPLTKEERALRDQALSELEPLAIERLRDQLDHPDPRVQQAAAKIILDHKWGRASQRQQEKADVQHTKVVYETAAAPVDLEDD